METKPHIIIVTDAWHPHLSGVLRVVESIATELDERSRNYTILHPQNFPGVPLPGYSEIKVVVPLFFKKTVDQLLKEHKNTSIHIMTEGPLGLTMRNYCVAKGLRFTTSFHTHWHKYMNVYFKVPQRVTMRYVRDFHKPSSRVLVPSEDAREELIRYGFINEIVVCANGVDTKLFKPREKTKNVVRPQMLYVGRVSTEKNIEEFLKLNVTGSKRVVGDGPVRKSFSKKYPEVEFTGALQGRALAQAYSDANVFVFPSKTDTFGVVLLEALASGVPVAAHFAPGPQSLITKAGVGSLNDNLEKAVLEALEKGDSTECVRYAQNFSWERITDVFINSLVEAGEGVSASETITAHLLQVPRGFYKLFTSAGYARSLLFGLEEHSKRSNE